MYSFDASSMIYAWDNYPIANPLFGGLWDWFAKQVGEKHFVFSKVAFDEVGHKYPECSEWLKENGVEIYTLSPSILLEAQSIKNLLEIEEEAYNPKGVDLNDLLIISTAKVHNLLLVSNEARQSLPPTKSKYKIPAVCALDGVNVVCTDFLDLLRQNS